MRRLKKIFKYLLILLLVVVVSVTGFYLWFKHSMQSRPLSARLQYMLEQALPFDDDCGAVFYIYRAGDGFTWQGTTGGLTIDTAYALASITKMYTAAVILQLADEGLLRLDDSIAYYLPETLRQNLHVLNGKDYTSAITIRQLLSHTSGLPDYFTENSPAYTAVAEIRKTADITYDMDGIIRRIQALQPHFVPGEEGLAFYADTNFQLLGIIIERITGMSLDEAYRVYITEPLNLGNTYLKTDDSVWEVADICHEGRKLIVPGIVVSEKSTGGMVSTAKENMVFLRAFFNGDLFHKNWLNQMQDFKAIQFFPIHYGTGLMQMKPPVPVKLPNYELIGHSGSLGTVSYYCPARDLYIVGTINRPNTAKAMEVAYRLLLCFNFR